MDICQTFGHAWVVRPTPNGLVMVCSRCGATGDKS